ncbi:GFA family protein [Blastomonas sp.]|uniref:GFA family protein n=1 Tax=Blastomonas sp. TaxID=1909299 RepID=UPI0035945C72
MIEATGGCHCGAVRYAVAAPADDAEAPRTALCHCSDCQHCAGAPVVGWTAVSSGSFRLVSGTPAVYRSSEHAQRSFCPQCGTGLFYVNEVVLPGIVDIQTATFDDANAFPAMAHIQTAEQLAWMGTAHELPAFERYPEG